MTDTPALAAVMDAVLRDERISKGCFPLLELVGEMADVAMNRATQEEIAGALGRSLPWVQKTAAHLAACGYLTVSRRTRNREAAYSLKLPTPAEKAYRGCAVWSDAKLPPDHVDEPAAAVAAPQPPPRTLADALRDLDANVARLGQTFDQASVLIDKLIARRAA